MILPGKHIGTLYPQPPYRFDLLLETLVRYQHPVTDLVLHDSAGRAYWRVLRQGQSLALVRVHADGPPESPQLQVHLVEQTGPVDEDALLSQVGRILGVEADRRAFYAYARQNDTLWTLVEPMVGLPQHTTETVFEALTLTTIEQQISWVAAQRAQRFLVEWVGDCIHHNGHILYAFPTPAQIAKATIDDLKPTKITFRRMGVLIHVGQQVSEGRLDLEGLRAQSPEKAYQTLLAIKGIGHWTATWTLTRVYGAQNYVGHNDVALQAAVNHYFYEQQGRIPAEMVQRTFSAFGEFAGMAAHFTLLRWVLDRYESNH